MTRVFSRHSGRAAAIAFVLTSGASAIAADALRLSEHQTLEGRGVSLLLYHNTYHPYFGDQKLGGLELILHDQRIATNGDVRLLPTPEQWDPIPTFEKRETDPETGGVRVHCTYGDTGLSYWIEAVPEGAGARIALHLDAALPEALAGEAAFSLEFLPTAYFGKTWRADDDFGLFPQHPGGPMAAGDDTPAQARPLAQGRRLVLSPEDPLTRVEIESESGNLSLYDGRNKAQNGWFVVRTPIPAGKTRDAVVWHLRPSRIEGWTREPVIAHSQAGYHPARDKVAVLELDPAFESPDQARVLRLGADGSWSEVFGGPIAPWGRWLRYDYAHFDFSSVREPGFYAVEYAGKRSDPFPIAEDVYAGIWQASLDTYLPIQMDHVKVREGYRIWHGPSHMDDARQAPANHTHFDGYAHGEETDSPFAAGEHIPGLNVGGWYDAGDFDIRTQTQSRVVTDLVQLVEDFGVAWDETTVDQAARSVWIRRPDGVPDAVQQVEHGALALLAQFDAVGHAIPGIVAPTLEQYTHLGDGGSKTDNRIYSEDLGPNDSDGIRSGIPDDRWAFTTKTTALQYSAAAALAAASRVLRDHDPALAQRCLETAKRAWQGEQEREPNLYQSFNTTGGHPGDEEVRATVELLLATEGDATYRDRLATLLPKIEERFWAVGALATRALPHMDAAFSERLATALDAYVAGLGRFVDENPFGVPVTRGGWGGSSAATGFAVSAYYLHRAFPDRIGPEHVFRGLEYVLGRHPASSVSMVSGVGADSQLVAYGFNRADYSYLAGGVIPGIVVVKPDYPELKREWPFLWFEHEYVIDGVTSYLLAANAAQALLK